MLSMRFIRRLIDSTLLDRPITPISLSPCCRRLHNRLALRPIPHHGARSLSVASPPPPFGSPCSISPRPQSPLLPRPQFLNRQHVRHKSSKSSGAWTRRQGRDTFTREAKVQGLKSRAAFKLLEVHYTHTLFLPSPISPSTSLLQSQKLTSSFLPPTDQRKVPHLPAARHRCRPGLRAGQLVASRHLVHGAGRARHRHRRHPRPAAARRVHHPGQLFEPGRAGRGARLRAGPGEGARD